MTPNRFRMRWAALLLLSAGYGWAGGHFIPADSPVVAYVFQFVVIGLLLATGLSMLSPDIQPVWRRRAVTTLSVFSLLSLLINLANVVHGAYSDDPHAFGSHNSFADLVPITLLIAGSGLWLGTLWPRRVSDVGE